MHVTTKKIALGAVAVAAVFIPATAGGENQPPPTTATAAVSQVIDPKCPQGVWSMKDYKTYASKVYKRNKVGKAALSRLKRMMSCQNSPQAERYVKRLRLRLKRERTIRQQIDACTPFGKWAIPVHIVMRESRGKRNARNKDSTAGGFYQFIDSTWFAYGGKDYHDTNPIGGFQHPAAMAPPEEQHCVAHRAWNGGNNNHWALTR